MKRGTFKHPKTDELASRLGIPFSFAGGLLGAMWEWVAEYTPAGNVGKYPNRTIAKQIGFDLDRADELVEAMVESGWLDRSDEHRLIVHDWPQHCEDSVHARLARAIQFFADGTKPSLKKLSKDERESVAAAYKAADGSRKAESGSPPPPYSPPYSPPPPFSLAADAAGKPDKPKKTKQKPEPKPRERNELIDAILAVDGSNPLEVTGNAWGRAGVALQQIREVSPDVTPDEIRKRAANYRLLFPKAACTPTGVATHWAACANPPRDGPPNGKQTMSEDDLMKLLEEHERNDKPRVRGVATPR